jgi:hypothetical protein
MRNLSNEIIKQCTRTQHFIFKSGFGLLTD